MLHVLASTLHSHTYYCIINKPDSLLPDLLFLCFLHLHITELVTVNMHACIQYCVNERDC